MYDATYFERTVDEIRRAYDDGVTSNLDSILQLANDAWEKYRNSISVTSTDKEQIGEICRRAAIACAAVRRPEMSVWRSRSLTLFTLAESANGVAMIVVMLALSTYAQGGREEALAELELMDLLRTPEASVIDPKLVESAMLENMAIVHIELEDWISARRELKRVIELESRPGEFRRLQKARASLTTIEYREGDQSKAIAELTEIVEECQSRGSAGSVVDIGTENLKLMKSGAWPLRPYQVI
jgi:hypothetical protein